MKIYTIPNVSYDPSSFSTFGTFVRDIKLVSFSKKEYADAYMQLYPFSGTKIIEVELDEQLPDMKSNVDELMKQVSS